jgi:hypothetical protein
MVIGDEIWVSSTGRLIFVFSRKDGARTALVVVWLLFVLFYVVFVCKCVLPPGDNPIAVNKYIIYYINEVCEAIDGKIGSLVVETMQMLCVRF